MPLEVMMCKRKQLQKIMKNKIRFFLLQNQSTGQTFGGGATFNLGSLVNTNKNIGSVL